MVGMSAPVVVGVVSRIAALNLLQELAELALIQLEVANETGLLVQVEGEHGQGGARSCLSKCKDVKLPVVPSILQYRLLPVRHAVKKQQRRELHSAVSSEWQAAVASVARSPGAAVL